MQRSSVKRLITAEDVDAARAAGQPAVAAPRGEVIVTPAAWSRAQQLGVTIDLEAAQQPGGQRAVDPSGVVLVRGSSVQLGRFADAGPEKNVRLADVISGKDKSPMTAGFMAWSAADSFPWTLNYDEIDYVLEGVLQITTGGRVVEGRPGDVLYIPKGSKILFGTPSRVRIFYVTYPADWAGAK
jgi:ethanolamine utilization protein EutQ (cupin superfamily)